MTSVDTLVTTFKLDASQYQQGGAAAIATTNAFARAHAKAANDVKANGFGKAFDGLKSSAKEAIDALDPLKTVIAGIVGVGIAGAAGGYGLMKQAAEFDSLKQSLIAVEGSATNAGQALSRLKELAKAPGLGFEQAVQAYSGLRNAGLSTKFADDLIREFASANARGGGNVETFERIMVQVRQAANRPYLSQQDLVPISEAGVPINKILKDRFGTGDTEELKAKGIDAQTALHGIVEELAKLKRVAGGEQNEFDNLGDAIKFAAVSAGEGLNKGLLPYFTKIANAAGELTDSGVIEQGFASIADNIQDILGDASGDMAKSLIPLVAGLVTVSAGFRNLMENIKGFIDLLSNPDSIAGRLLGWKEGQKRSGDGISLGDEYQRTVQELENKLEASRKIRDGREKRGLNPDGTKKKPEDDSNGSSFAQDKTIPLLERVARATEKTADVQTQLQGGSTNAKNVTSAYGMRQQGGASARAHLDNAVWSLQQMLDVTHAEASAQNVNNARMRMS